jgi:superfamily II DNA/RNA helicase
MACNSTYLLDPSTDFGTKVDEMISRLDELLETRDVKVVIFSQWVRSHELLSARLDKQRRKFVLLHGGIPGPKRDGLISRFREQSDCRVFLSTDAGGVGLNLQNASAVLNMDQPWNPAILEQRIGRVHRMGQKRPVDVMHFVARDTIEHGMLDLLRFKKSLFTGVLDGTQDEVFMGGSRLKKFMDSVEAATGSIPASATDSGSGQRETIDAHDSVKDQSPSISPAQDDYTRTISTLLGLGKSLLDNLAQAVGNRATSSAGWKMEPDAATGQPCLKIPIPSPEVIGKANLWLQAIAGALGGAGEKALNAAVGHAKQHTRVNLT